MSSGPLVISSGISTTTTDPTIAAAVDEPESEFVDGVESLCGGFNRRLDQPVFPQQCSGVRQVDVHGSERVESLHVRALGYGRIMEVLASRAAVATPAQPELTGRR
jgi:hypothetical protein